VARAGAGWLAPQPQFTAAWLAQRMAELLDRPAELATAARQARKMGRPDAAEHLAKMVLSLVPAPADHAGSAA
jgi:UDP-N-acetylglucosamine--N-acetylmuramyl-(pentapeptide) pyrophosphoryl-undecaprenol N-acetylglucosamine transferase